jgi:hypothetical protein
VSTANPPELVGFFHLTVIPPFARTVESCCGAPAAAAGVTVTEFELEEVAPAFLALTEIV